MRLLRCWTRRPVPASQDRRQPDVQGDVLVRVAAHWEQLVRIIVRVPLDAPEIAIECVRQCCLHEWSDSSANPWCSTPATPESGVSLACGVRASTVGGVCRASAVEPHRLRCKTPKKRRCADAPPRECGLRSDWQRTGGRSKARPTYNGSSRGSCRAPMVQLCADLKRRDGHSGYDHNWVLRPRASLAGAAVLTDPTTGRRLEIATTEPGLQFYSGNFLNGQTRGRANQPLVKHADLCLETQHFPDAPHHPHFPSTVLRCEDVYESTTPWRFRAI